MRMIKPHPVHCIAMIDNRKHSAIVQRVFAHDGAATQHNGDVTICGRRIETLLPFMPGRLLMDDLAGCEDCKDAWQGMKRGNRSSKASAMATGSQCCHQRIG